MVDSFVCSISKSMKNVFGHKDILVGRFNGAVKAIIIIQKNLRRRS